MANIERLKQLRQAVLDAPSFNMGVFGGNTETGYKPDTVKELVNLKKHYPCQTAACIAGEACLLAYHDENYPSSFITSSFSDTAANWLKLDEYEAEWLFYGNFTKRYTFLMNIPKRLAIEAIDWLIGKNSVLIECGFFVKIDELEG